MINLEYQFNIGDVVKLTSSGGVYEFYRQAFEHFGVIKNCTKTDSGYTVLRMPIDYKNYRWIVKGIAIHENKHDVLYLLASIETHEFVVYSGEDKEHIFLDPNFPQSRTDKIREKYKNYVIRQIKNN